ncbi:MAG: hypothetical protein SGPRY_007133 [Prymnesium sp.]
MRAASASIRRLPRALVRWEHAGGSGQGSASAKFGRNVAKEDSAAQNLSDVGRGRYDYIYDFMSSMQKGPVKLDFGDRAPTKKELEQFEAQERALQMMKRAMVLGTLIAAGGVYAGWVLSKRALGVTDAKQFSEVMGQKMPKLLIATLYFVCAPPIIRGRRLKEKSAASRDAISEDPELTAWRRSLRDKAAFGPHPFNTDEGKQIARQNSIILAEKRKKERIERRLKGENTEAMTINSSPSENSNASNAKSESLSGAAADTNKTSEQAASKLEDETVMIRSDSRVVSQAEANKLKRRASVSWAGSCHDRWGNWLQLRLGPAWT